MSFGLKPEGFVRKSQAAIISEVETKQRSDIRNDLTFGVNEPLAILNGIYSEGLAQAWELLAILAIIDPDAAVDWRLDQLCNITGTRRGLDTYSVVELECTFTGVANFTAGVQRVRHESIEGIEFVALADFTSTGAGTELVGFRATVTGPVQVAAGTLTEIVTPAANWAGVTNLEDALPGANRQTDGPLKEKRAIELASGGGASFPTMNSAVSRIEGVTSHLILNNRRNVTDSNGVPPKSVEVIVLGGDDADIARVLFENASLGTGFYGNTTVIVVDEKGNSHEIKFTRPAELDVWLTFEIATTSEYIGETAHKTLISNLGNAYAPDEDAYYSKVICHGFGLQPEEMMSGTFNPIGIKEVRQVWIGLTEPDQFPVSLAATHRQVIRYDTSRIDIVYVGA